MLRQFKPTPEWAPNDQLTISPDHLTTCINYIKKFCYFARASQQQSQPVSQQMNVPQPAATGHPPNQAPMPALNANNLQQLQQQEEALQRARRPSTQSASGSGTAPAPFGAPSPQGVPHAYGPGSMPPEKLKLPPPKKRKQSHAGPIPGQAATPGTPNSKTVAAKTSDGKPAPTALPFKCGVVECQHHYHGFVSQPALDKHIEENHKEVIEDPLEFALESMRNCLVKEEKVEAPGLKKGAAVATEASGKGGETKPEGATPVASGATPMGRMPSQLKAGSPASNQQMTPRASSGKTPATMKATVSKEGKKEAGKSVEPSGVDATTKDPWADSGVSLEAIHDTFADFGNEGLNGLGIDPMEEFLNADMFTGSESESKDTPESVETGGATLTPKDGELSKGEEMNVKIGSNLDDSNWLPDDWACQPGRFNDQFLVSGPTEIDWDSIDQKAMDGPDQPGLAIYAM